MHRRLLSCVMAAVFASVAHADIEDFVLLRANGSPMFLLANAVDDAEMGITHVLRGEEHVNGTPKYLLIQDAIGAPRPTFARPQGEAAVAER